MKEVFIKCAATALIGAFIRLIAEGSGEERISNLISTITGVLILLTLFQSCSQTIKIDLPNPKSAELDYAAISNDTIKKAIELAEKSLEEKICEDLKYKFSSSPIHCEVKLNNENANIKQLKIYYSKNTIISTYEVLNYISLKYDANAEVIFQ